MTNLQTGRLGEEFAKQLLLKKGYQIISQNFRSRWGEIDLIAQKDKKLIFVEVKSRIGTAKGKPYEAITKRKIYNLRRPIQYFLLQNNYKNYKLSLDVISVIFNRDQEIEDVKHFENLSF